MLTLPKPLLREAQDYIYVPFTVRMTEMQRPAMEGFPLLFDYLGRLGVTPVGPAFYNYRRIDMADTLDVEAGIAVPEAVPAEGPIKTGTLPGGSFLGLTWHGHPDQLEPVTAVMIGYARQTDQAFDMHTDARGDHFACRLELYETDPDEEPDMDKWVTRLEFKLRD